MVQNHQVEGYENFKKFMKELNPGDDPVYVYFTGSKKPDGESWCEDCKNAWPVVEQEVEKNADPNAHFVYVEVGDRTTWKDMKCPFRTDPETKLMVIPTLVKWKCPQKLELDQCGKAELVCMLFEEHE